MGFLSFFQMKLSKVGLLLGGRALSFFLIKMGCAGGLSLAMVFVIRGLLTAEATPSLGNMMVPGGSGTSSSGERPYLDLTLGPPQAPAAPASSIAGPSGAESGASTSFPKLAWEPALSPPAIPHAEQAMGDPDLALQLGQPGVEIAPIHWGRLEKYLSPDFRLDFPLPETPIQKVESRIILENLDLQKNIQRPLAEAQQLVRLKAKIFDSMRNLDQSPFWVENKDFLLGHSLLRADGLRELTTQCLEARLLELNTRGQNASFYKDLIVIKNHYQRFLS